MPSRSFAPGGFGRTVIRLLLHRDESGQALADNADRCGIEADALAGQRTSDR